MCEIPYLSPDEEYWCVGCEECGEVMFFLDEVDAEKIVKVREKTPAVITCAEAPGNSEHGRLDQEAGGKHGSAVDTTSRPPARIQSSRYHRRGRPGKNH